MSDTPRCDAYEVRDGIRYDFVPRAGMPDWPKFARQLERELASEIVQHDASMRQANREVDRLGVYARDLIQVLHQIRQHSGGGIRTLIDAALEKNPENREPSVVIDNKGAGSALLPAVPQDKAVRVGTKEAEGNTRDQVFSENAVNTECDHDGLRTFWTGACRKCGAVNVTNCLSGDKP